jgi:hypothetical protein
VLKSDGSLWSCADDADTGINQVVGGGGVTGSILLRTLTLGSTATPANVAGAIVARDGAGSFLAGSVGLAGSLDLPDTTSASVGVLTKGGVPFLHSFGAGNTFVGSGAGNFSLTGWDNSAFGLEALHADTSGESNSAFGAWALHANTWGYWNSAFGFQALASNTGGSYSAAFGMRALIANTTGSYNSAFGFDALTSNTEGTSNSAFGLGALHSNTTGTDNSSFGAAALLQVSTGSYNIAVGARAGENLTSGSHNIYIGNPGETSESSTIRIGDINQTATYIAGISGATSAGGLAVYVASDGKVGTTTSSRRYKEQIVDMTGESDVLLKLRPVSFYYRKELDETHLRQYGLVAEEVADVAPDLVAYDEEGAPQAVRYHFVNAMLLNEVQKQRRRIEAQDQQLRAQDAEIHELRAQGSRIRDLEARLARLEAAGRNQ